MSLELARQVDRDHPHLLETNIAATCHQYTLRLIVLLRSLHYEAYPIAKTSGEGQYTPPGFQPRTVIGLDNKPYVCTGVSHDAIWVNGTQVDTAARANDSDEPIYENDEKKARGERLTAVPVWNLIPEQYWRAKNPPLKDFVIDGIPMPPQPPTPWPPAPPPPRLPSYAELGDDAFFRAMIGVPLFADYLIAGQPPNDGMAVWFSRAIYRLMAALINAKGQPIDPAGEVRIVRNEWRQILGLPPV